MRGFAVDEPTINCPAFRGLSAQAARLLLLAAVYCPARKLRGLNDKAIRALQAKPAEAWELVTAGFWAAEDDQYVGAIDLESPRARSARVAGEASARARAERYGTAQPRKPERSPNGGSNVPERPPERGRTIARTELERSPNGARTFTRTQLERSAERSRTEANDATDPPSPPDPPLPSQISSFSALSAVSFPLLASLQGPESKRAHADDELETRSKSVANSERKRRPTWRRVSPEWQPTAEHARIAHDRRVDLALEIAKFRDHEFATPKRDPDATFRNWLRSARPELGARPPVSTGYKHATLDEIDQILGAK